MQDNIYPMTLWEDFGITSYNVASSGEQMEVTYYVLKEVLKTKTPRVVVVDVYRLHAREEGFDENPGLIHGSMDFMPFSDTKVELAKNAAKAHETSLVSFLSSIYAYHGRWKELGQEDFEPKYSKEKGAIMLSGIYEHERPEFYPEAYDEEKLKGCGYEYMKKILGLCQEKGIKCIFVNIPYTAVTKGRETIKNTCFAAIEKDGALVLDMNDYIDEMGIDYSCDFRDDDGHLNIVGSKKATDFLGKYLLANSDIKDWRSDSSVCDKWNADLENYNSYKLEQAKQATNAVSCVMYGYNMPDWDISVYSCEVKDSADSRALEKLCSIMNVELKKCKADDEPDTQTDMSEAEKSYLVNSLGCEKLGKNQIYVTIKNKQDGSLMAGGLY